MLVVDDRQTILLAMNEYFRSMCYDVDCANDLNGARELIASQDYSLVLSDLRLTGSSDLEGLEVIRMAREKSSSTRIVILTAYGSPEVEAEAKRLGADIFLYKPQPLREVARQAIQLLEGHRPFS